MKKTALKCFLLCAGLAGPAAAEPLLEALTTQGVAVAPGETLRLPEPTLPDGLPAAQQRKRIEAAIEGRAAWDAFTRKAVVAPYVLKIEGGADDGGRRGRRVDLWFVAYGELDAASSDDFLEKQFENPSGGGGSAPAARPLSDAELLRRRLAPPTRPEDARYVTAELALFDKLQVRGVTRSVRTRTAESTTAASILDERFAADPEFPNVWRPVDRDEAGRRRIGEPHPYAGLGSYVKATRLAEPSGALFVEYHVVFQEPKEWFNGANLLRSKLPLVAQEVVRKLRRGLAKEGE